MNAVIYARYSSDNQREESIEGQLRECKAFAESKGMTVIGTYIDRAMSAKTDNRPEFQRMVKESVKHQFEVVLVWKLDRFARDRYHSAHYKAQLKKNNVKVVSATESISDDASGILLESILEGFAEYYSVDLGEKIKRGLTENALKCKYNGGTLPLGYVISDDQTYHIDPVTAPVVMYLFEQYANGTTMKQLVDHLKNIGVKNFFGNDFTINSVKNTLTNRKYIGEYSYGDIKKVDGMPSIINADLFEKVAHRMAKNKKSPARFKAKGEMYLLSTKLHCGKCGAYMVGECGTSKTKKTYQYYKCCHVKQKKGCNKKTVRKNFIEELVLKHTTKLLFDDEYIHKIATAAYQYQQKENSVIPVLKKQIAEVERGLKNLIAAIEQGIISESTKDRLNELEKSKKSLNESLAIEQLKRPTLSQEQIEFWLLKLRELDITKDYDKQILVDNFINAIYLYDDKIVLVFNYKSESHTVSLVDIKSSDMKMKSPP